MSTHPALGIVSGPLFPGGSEFKMWWKAADGGYLVARAAGFPTEDLARTHATVLAKEMGWTPPRWWQLSRWDEPVWP